MRLNELKRVAPERSLRSQLASNQSYDVTASPHDGTQMIEQRCHNPFQDALSRALARAPALSVISLTDARGDQIGVVWGSEAQVNPEALGLIQVYGQLAHQRAPCTIHEVSAQRDGLRWTSLSLRVESDRYDLWAVWSTDKSQGGVNPTQASTSALTQAEVSVTLNALARELTPLLMG